MLALGAPVSTPLMAQVMDGVMTGNFGWPALSVGRGLVGQIYGAGEEGVKTCMRLLMGTEQITCKLRSTE